MFIGAPLGAYETHSRRAELVADTSGAWPRMETDLRAALPNSLRARRNGNFVVIEMLAVARRGAVHGRRRRRLFTTAGRLPPRVFNDHYLWVNNSAAPDGDPYSVRAR